MAKKSQKETETTAPAQETYLAQWQMAQADLENLQKRAARERIEAAAFAERQIILELLPVVDNFDRALGHVPAEQGTNSWLTGITYIHKQLLDWLGTRGVERVEVKVGDAFDPQLHHAVQSVASETVVPDHIVSVVAAPYRQNGELLRPGSVVVAQANSQE